MTHSMTTLAFIGGPASAFKGTRRQVAACANFPCTVIRLDDASLAVQEGPDCPVPQGCPGAIPPMEPAGTPVAGAGRASEALPPSRGSGVRRRRDDSDQSDTDQIEIDDPLRKMVRKTLNIAQAAKTIKAGRSDRLQIK